jgi:hypothetical protein
MTHSSQYVFTSPRRKDLLPDTPVVDRFQPNLQTPSGSLESYRIAPALFVMMLHQTCVVIYLISCNCTVCYIGVYSWFFN